MLWLLILTIISAILSVYAFLIAPRLRDRADMDMITVNYAHRGLWSAARPENSLAAFAAAVQRNFGIELDVQLSKDKHIVVFHDRDLKRMCGVDKKISDLTIAELKALKLGNSNQTIPTLPEVLRLVDGRVPLLIELKSNAADTELCKRVAAVLDKYNGAFCVESFDPLLVSWFKKYRPRYVRGQLVTKKKKLSSKRDCFVSFCLSKLLANFLSRPDFIAVDVRMKNSFVIYICHKIFKVPIFVWSVRTERTVAECVSDGYFFIFEKPKSN